MSTVADYEIAEVLWTDNAILEDPHGNQAPIGKLIVYRFAHSTTDQMVEVVMPFTGRFEPDLHNAAFRRAVDPVATGALAELIGDAEALDDAGV